MQLLCQNLLAMHFKNARYFALRFPRFYRKNQRILMGHALDAPC